MQAAGSEKAAEVFERPQGDTAETLKEGTSYSGHAGVVQAIV